MAPARHGLIRGQNVAVPTATLRVVVNWASTHTFDVSLLLLAGDGKVRSDDDFVFFNQRRHPSGAASLDDSGAGTSTLTVALPSVPAAVDRIAVIGSVDDRSTVQGAGLRLQVNSTDGSPVHGYSVLDVEPVCALVLGEFYRRGDGWKFRAVGQGWQSGLAGVATHFGINIEDPRPAAPPTPPTGTSGSRGGCQPGPGGSTTAQRADWYADPHDARLLRWWSGLEWSTETRNGTGPDTCARCGAAPRRRWLGRGSRVCRACEPEVRAALHRWHTDAARLLDQRGPTDGQWDELWSRLRHARVAEIRGREVLRPDALAHLGRLVALAFADGRIEASELDAFRAAVAALGLEHDVSAAVMSSRMHRGRHLTGIRDGALPRHHALGLHLDLEEVVHLDVRATNVRQLVSGTRRNSGRLVASDRKLRFLGDGGGGTEVSLSKIVAITVGTGSVKITATASRGGGLFEVADPEYTEAVLSSALRIFKRHVLPAGARETRSIPQAVKIAVWNRDRGACVQCHATQPLEYDHIIPYSKGGATSANNLQLLCRRCNQQKGARL